MAQKAIASASSSPVAAGAFYDNGAVVANGFLLLKLALADNAVAAISGGGEVSTSSYVKLKLDANGVPTAGQTLWCSDQFSSPTNPAYRVRVYNSAGSMVSDLGNCVISGTAPVDLTTLTPTSGGPSYNGAVLLTPSGNQVIASGNLTLTTGQFIETAHTVTGSGNLVRDTSPTLVTPTLGVATATTVNKVTITAPATGSTLTIADGKTATVNNSLTLAGTDATTMTFPSTSQTVVGLTATQTLTNKTLNGASSGNSVNLVNLQAATAQLTGNSADQTIWTFSLAGNTMRAGTGVEFDIWLTHDVGTAAPIFKLTYGGTAVSVTIGVASPSTQHFRGVIHNNAGVTNAQKMFLDGLTTNSSVAGNATAAIDSTANQTVTFTFNAANTDKVTGLSLRTIVVQ